MVSKIILGTVQLGLPYGINGRKELMPFDDAMELLDEARKANIETLDTAESYGMSQIRIGKYQEISGFNFKINTKFKSFGSLDQFDKKIDQCLKELNTDKINLLMSHSGREDNYLFTERYRKIAEDRVDKFGMSLYDTNQLYENDLESIDVIQIPFNILDNYNLRGSVIKLLKSKFIEIHIRSIFLQGLLFNYTNVPNQKLLPLVSEIVSFEKHLESEFPLSQLALCYPFLIEEIDGILIGVDSSKQLRNNIESILSTAPVMENKLKSIHDFHIKNKKLLDPRNWL